MDQPEVFLNRLFSPAALNQNEVHIWLVDLSDFANTESALLKLLSTDEHQRAERYQFETDRLDYILRRGAMRLLLGSYLAVQPAKLEFIYNNYGKPALDVEAAPIYFNASSSNHIELLAITNVNIGVDIELVDIEFPYLEIAKRYFSTDEVREILNLQPDLQATAFFNCWTKKEAYIKAIGDGMSHPLPELAISSDEHGQFSVNAISNETTGWCISSFIPQLNYIASIAYEGEPKSVSYFRWQMS